MQQSKKKSSIWTGHFVVFLVMATFYFMNNYMLNPVLAGYTKELGGTANLIGLVSGAMSGVALFLTPLAGPLVDRYNRKTLAIVSFSLLIAANVLACFANTASVLLGARILQGVGFSLASVILSTVVSTMFDDDCVGKAIGIYASMQALAQIIAPSAGIMIRDAFGCRVDYYVATGFTIVCFLITLRLNNFGKRSEKTAVRSFSWDAIISVSGIPFALTSVVCGFLLQIVTAFVDPFAKLTGNTDGIQWFFTIYAGSMLLSRSFLSGMMDKKSLGFFVLICCPLCVLALYLLQIQNSPLVLWTAAVCCAVGLGFMQIMAQVVLVKTVPVTRRGVASSTYYIAMNLGHALGGYLGGILIDGVHGGDFFYYWMVVSLLPLLFAGIFRKQYFAVPKPS